MSLQLAIIRGLEQNAARWLSADSRLILSIDDFDKVTASNCACKCHHVRIPATRWINSKRPNEPKATAFLPLFLISAGNNIRKEFVFFLTITPNGEGRGWCLEVYMIQKEQAGSSEQGLPRGKAITGKPLHFLGSFNCLFIRHHASSGWGKELPASCFSLPFSSSFFSLPKGSGGRC